MSRTQKNKAQNNRVEIHFTFQGVRTSGCLFLFCLLLSCVNSNHIKFYEKVEQAKSLLKSGDIIVRDGNDEISRTARNFNRKDKSYSHCGIIQIEHDTVFVYHALGGNYNPSQKLLKQPLHVFCNPKETNNLAIFRYELNKDEKKILSNWIHNQYGAGLRFDLFFDFYTDDKMYCSEFVFKGLNTATNGGLNQYLRNENNQLYVTIDDLYLNDKARLIFNLSGFK